MSNNTHCLHRWHRPLNTTGHFPRHVVCWGIHTCLSGSECTKLLCWPWLCPGQAACSHLGISLRLIPGSSPGLPGKTLDFSHYLALLPWSPAFWWTLLLQLPLSPLWQLWLRRLTARLGLTFWVVFLRVNENYIAFTEEHAEEYDAQARCSSRSMLTRIKYQRKGEWILTQQSLSRRVKSHSTTGLSF